MNLYIEILAIEQNSDGLVSVEFSCFDGDDTGMVSFVSKIDLAQACFLSNHVLHYDDHSAYAQMMRAVAAFPDLPLFVGQKFESEDE